MRSQLLLKIEILFDEICRVSRLGIAAKSKLHLLGSLMELHRISEILKQGSFLENSIKSKKLAGNLHKQLKNQAVSTRVPVNRVPSNTSPRSPFLVSTILFKSRIVFELKTNNN